MPRLLSCLQGQDFSYLRIVAGFWGIELPVGDAREAAKALAAMLPDRTRFQQVLQALPAQVQQALAELVENKGQLSWPVFTRKYGELREMGAARRDREKPHANSQATATEILYYRALLARTFRDTPAGPAEFAVLPDEWLDFLAPDAAPPEVIFGRPASPGERGRVLATNDSILDDACTLLAGLRCSVSAAQLKADLRCGRDTPFPLQDYLLEILLIEAGLVDEQRLPRAETVRQFLEAAPAEALSWLVRSWLNSNVFDEMRLLPGVTWEGPWRTDPVQTRQLLLGWLSRIPGGKAALGVAGKPWWSFQSFISAVYQHQPDFQRQAGEYEAWFLRSESDGQPLSGFDHWQQVEGALLRFCIAGPLHWLGILDLSYSRTSSPDLPAELSAFRFSSWSSALVEGVAPEMPGNETGSLVVRSNGLIHVPQNAPRAGRYQVARFCEWLGEKDGVYRYRLTHAALQKASQQGLKVEHVLGILQRYAKAVPPTLVKALKHWEAQGSPARLEQLTVLRVKNPDLLKTLRSSETSRFLGELLGPAAVVVKPGAWQKLVDAMMEMGYFTDEIDG